MNGNNGATLVAQPALQDRFEPAKAEEFDFPLASEHYKLGHSPQEIERMRNQHEWIKGSFGGLIKAPIDYSKPGQKILDSATADGKSKFQRCWSP
jgi:hypothetical protein